MSEIIIIACPDPNEAQSLSRQLTAVSKEFVILEADSTENLQMLCREYGCALLFMDHELYREDAADFLVPKDTILLLQVKPDQTEKYAAQLTQFTGICDMIPPAAPTAVLRYKIQFLLRQRNLNRKCIRLQEEHTELTKKLNDTEQALNSQQHYLDILTERDGLTGLYNRKHLTTVLRNEFQHAKRYGTEFTLLLLDIDHFKIINRKYGHLYGDFILNEIAARLTSNTRGSDLCFRFGGGNFIILLPQATLKNGCQAAEKLKDCCESKKFDNGQNNHQITVSIGIASFIESSPETPEQLINMADTAMCQAKAEGKSRYMAYPLKG